MIHKNRVKKRYLYTYTALIIFSVTPANGMMARVRSTISRAAQEARQTAAHYRGSLFAKSQTMAPQAMSKTSIPMNSQLPAITSAAQQKINFLVLAPWIAGTAALITTLSNTAESQKIDTENPATPLSFDEAVTVLFLSLSGCPLYSSPEVGLCKNVSAFKDLIKKYGITATDSLLFTIEPWNEQDWTNAHTTFATYQNIQQSHRKRPGISLNQAPQFLDHAKTILKSFLSPQPISATDLKEKYIKKTDLRRLFTYTKLQSVIQNKQLSHVRLPKKILVIRDRPTGNYVWGQEAYDLIDNLFHAYLSWPEEPSIRIDYFDNRYEFFIYAQRECSHRPFNKAALEELIQLLKAAPFDVGFDNIFADENGDAVIIDTEFKGEGSGSSIAKLVGRYSTPQQLREFQELYEKNGHL